MIADSTRNLKAGPRRVHFDFQIHLLTVTPCNRPSRHGFRPFTGNLNANFARSQWARVVPVTRRDGTSNVLTTKPHALSTGSGCFTLQVFVGRARS